MIDIVKFVVFIIFFVYFPGRAAVELSNIKLSPVEKNFISFGLGIPILTFLVWVLGYLGGENLAPFLIFLGDFLLLRKLKFQLKLPAFSKRGVLPVLVVLIGALFQMSLMLKSGTFYQGGVAFWGVHGYDGIWHTSLIQELVNYFPPQNPGFAGEPLKNYHYLTDLFYAQAHKVTQIPILDLYFRFNPIFLAILLNGLIYLFAKKWSGSKIVACWTVFFTSVAGSFGWIPPLFGKGSNNWETAFWGIQPASSFLNPPFAVSLILLMCGLILLDEYLKVREKKMLPVIVFVFGIMTGFKIYGGMIVLAALGALGLWELFRKKREIFWAAVFGGILTLVVYLPISSGSTNYLVWHPWWFIKTMVEAPDRLNWPSLELRRQVYVAYHNWRNLFLLQALAFFIFLLGNLGTRFLGFFSLLKKLRLRREIDLFLFFLIILAFLPPIFFIQKNVVWNSIQFLYYFTFVFSFFAAEAMVTVGQRIKPILGKIVFGGIVILAAMPSTMETVYWFNSPVPTVLLEAKEVEALNFLKEKSKREEILLTYPYGQLQLKHFVEPPAPMTYYNSPYVAFFTGRRVYLEDQNAATILSYDLRTRLDKEKDAFMTKDPQKIKSFLLENRIKFVYLVDWQKFEADISAAGIKEIFNNQKVRIYEVDGKIESR